MASTPTTTSATSNPLHPCRGRPHPSRRGSVASFRARPGSPWPGFLASCSSFRPDIIRAGREIALCFVGATLRFWASGIWQDSVPPSEALRLVRNPLYLGTYLMAIEPPGPLRTGALGRVHGPLCRDLSLYHSGRRDEAEAHIRSALPHVL